MTERLKVKSPDVVGVPDNKPPELRVSPAGSEALLDQAYGGVPPCALNGAE